MIRSLAVTLVVSVSVLIARPLYAQLDVAPPASQGRPAAATDATAWPIKIVFGNVPIDPRDVSDRANRLLGLVTFAAPQHVIIDAMPAGGAGLTNTELRATAVPVTCTSGCAAGTPGQATMAASSPVVIASNQTAVPVSGTFFQATQPVSGSVSVSNFPATQPVSGAIAVSNLPATQPVSGTVAVSNFPATQAVSLAAMPTTPVTGPVTDAQLRASAVSVSGTFWQATQPVSGTFWQATQPISGSVTVSSAPTTAVTGPVTDAQLRAAPVAVTGTFYQATQPVSGSGSFTVVQGTGTNLHVVCDSGCAAGSPGQQPMAASAPVVIASNQSAVPVTLATAPTTPVTGTFWQSTQPVSIATMPSTPVTGTFWQATQPVSIASMPSTPVTGTFWQVTQPVSGTVTATPPALTKGTQGATGVSTQDLKDSGRTLVTLTADAVTPAASETLITVAKLVGDTVTAGVTTYAVTSGKTLRIQGLSLSLVSSTTTVNKVRVRLRTLSSGACLATSPVVATWELAWPTAVAAVVANSPGVSRDVTFVDGLEFSGATRNVCLSAIAAAANGTLSVSLLGFEY